MAADLYVPDANVFLEHIYARPLQEISKKLIRAAVLEQIQLTVPARIISCPLGLDHYRYKVY